MKSRRTLSLSLAIVVSLLLFGSSIVYAKVAGMCGNCHTMHNSQGGTNMMINTSIDGTGGVDGGGYDRLTRGTCVGCHTGSNDGGSTPFVFDTGSVTYAKGAGGVLAGGNFKWTVNGNDAKGHNVKGIPDMTADGDLSVAPGDLVSGSCANGCHATLFTSVDDNGNVLDTGCQGCHREQAHHAPQQVSGTPALGVNGYFRFLSGHMGGQGVFGIEDSDWQYTNDANDHNEYLGNAANKDNTMTGYCVGCHGNFHNQVSTVNGEWIRHPSDAVLPNSGEYTGYVNYDPMVPVARPDLGGITDTALVANNADMVMCLSCHRAHGSPYDDILRWDYTGMVAGGGGDDDTGCFVCHTQKD